MRFCTFSRIDKQPQAIPDSGIFCSYVIPISFIYVCFITPESLIICVRLILILKLSVHERLTIVLIKFYELRRTKFKFLEVILSNLCCAP